MANLDKEVMKELTNIRKLIQTVKKDSTRFAVVKDTILDEKIAEDENATCELSEDIEATVSDLENAICELSEIIEGGN